MDDFWTAIAAQLTELRSATTADDVIRILSADRGVSLTPYPSGSAEVTFYGSGGDGTVRESLQEAGWRVMWAEASYYYAMRAPGGDVITYVEGDVFRGDAAPKR